MKTYMILKPIYNERAKRMLNIGELFDFDDYSAAILIEKDCLTPFYEGITASRRSRRRKFDSELVKLKDTDF